METSDGYEVISYKTCAKLAYNAPGIAYTLVRIPEDPTQGNWIKLKFLTLGFKSKLWTTDYWALFIYFNLVTVTFSCVMKFIVKDCDPNTGEPDNDEGYQDEPSHSVCNNIIFITIFL